MEQCQTSWSRKNSVKQRAERFSSSQSKNLAETGGKWKMYFTLISLSSQWGLKAHTLFHCLLSGGPTPSSEWFLKGPHLISPFTQWAACSPHFLLSDSYNTYTKVKVVSPCEVWVFTGFARCLHTCNPMFKGLYFNIHTCLCFLWINTYHVHIQNVELCMHLPFPYVHSSTTSLSVFIPSTESMMKYT